jgi:hypothetical protein
MSDKDCHGCAGIRQYCLTGRLEVDSSGLEVELLDAELKQVWDDSRSSVPFRKFAEQVRHEARRQATEAYPAVSTAQNALVALPYPNEIALHAFRFCFRIGWIRICVIVFL